MLDDEYTLAIGCVNRTGHEQPTWCLLLPTHRQRRSRQAAAIRQRLQQYKAKSQAHRAVCSFILLPVASDHLAQMCQHAARLCFVPSTGYSRGQLCCWDGLQGRNTVLFQGEYVVSISVQCLSVRLTSCNAACIHPVQLSIERQDLDS